MRIYFWKRRSSNFLNSAVPRASSFHSLRFFNPSYRAHFQPLFLCSLPVATEFCDSFHRAHHGNPVRPGKNAPRRAQGHVLYKRPKASGPFPFEKLVSGMAKAQDGVCVAQTVAFYRLADKND